VLTELVEKLEGEVVVLKVEVSCLMLMLRCLKR